MSNDFIFTIKTQLFDENYQPADNTRITTNFANLARGERRKENLQNALQMIDNRFNALANWDNPNADRYALELEIVSVDMEIAGSGQSFPTIEILKTNILDRKTNKRTEGIVGNNFSSYVRDYDFSVVLQEHNKGRNSFSIPEGFGELHGKLFKYFVNSPVYQQHFAKPPVICLSVSDNKVYHRTENQHPVLGIEYQPNESSLTEQYFKKMGLQVRYFMPPDSVAPLAFYFFGDLLCDGEQTRQHFVTTFIEHLNGVDFENRKTVKIRDRYEASVPTVVGAVSRTKPVFVEDAKFLRQQTDKPIKWALPGPMTMIDTLYDAHYQSREKLAWEFAKILNQEAKELEAAGVDIIQFDEPAFNVFFEDVSAWGIAALERAIEGLKCETVVHICYGYGIKANTDWKKTLGSEWRQYEEIFPKLQKSAIDIISLECHNSRVPIELLELVRGKKVMVGAIDVANNSIETPEEVADTLRKALKYVDADKLYPCTNCGMAPLSRRVARGKLNALSQGAEIVRKELLGAL